METNPCSHDGEYCVVMRSYLAPAQAAIMRLSLGYMLTCTAGWLESTSTENELQWVRTSHFCASSTRTLPQADKW